MIRKVYKVDSLYCPTCGGMMRIISFIRQPKVIHRIIRYLRLDFEAERPPQLHNDQKEIPVNRIKHLPFSFGCAIFYDIRKK